MNQKTRVAILFGGRSAEHEVSLQSARNVIDAIDSEKYETVLIGIDRAGAWFLNEDSIALLNSDDPRLISLNKSNLPVSLIPGDQAGILVDLQGGTNLPAIDLLFPVLHGPYGEDGSVQGLAKLANVPCVGSDILGSAIAMDKDVSKRLLRDAGIPVSRHICLRRAGLTNEIRHKLQQDFGFPLYVKPANMGSSVGVSKVSAADELDAAVDSALQYDTKVVIEEAIVGREIECSILGNDTPLASAIGEIGTADGFYSYEAKYIDDNAAELIIPASLEPAVEQRVREMAIHAFQVLECRGMARVDMFLTADNEIFVNEINTIPGFTAISMYPKLWQTSGMSYTDLIDRLIQLALEEHDAKSQLTTTGY
jgi:D-alanine-D-alanine ligase